MITIREAATRGVERVRKPEWANSLDHLKIDVVDGAPGPWVHLFSPMNDWCNRRDPVDLLATAMNRGAYDVREWLPYDGPTSESDEYNAERKRWEGVAR